MKKPRIGLVLGGGAARGWAHIGVIRALHEVGIRPSIVCGTSIGALVGAAYAAGELERLENWVRGLGIRDVLGLIDVTLSGGVIKGERLMNFFRQHVEDVPIEKLPMPFGAVATLLDNGGEVWMREGSTLDAVRASFAAPGVFAPVVREDRVLADGGLVNPVPVSLARAMGADFIIAVDLSSDLLIPRLREDSVAESESPSAVSWIQRLQKTLGGAMASRESPVELAMPSVLEVLLTSVNIMQVRITRSRMAGEPPDVLITPRLAHIRFMEFYRANEAIEEGRRAVERAMQNLALLNAGNRKQE